LNLISSTQESEVLNNKVTSGSVTSVQSFSRVERKLEDFQIKDCD